MLKYTTIVGYKYIWKYKKEITKLLAMQFLRILKLVTVRHSPVSVSAGCSVSMSAYGLKRFHKYQNVRFKNSKEYIWCQMRKIIHSGIYEKR